MTGHLPSPAAMSAILHPVLALALAIGGCTTVRTDDAAPDAQPPTTDAPRAGTSDLDAVPTGEVRIALGESVAVDGVPVRFVRIAEDSRCPPGVSCVWAGRAHVELVIDGETHVLSVPGYGQDDQPAEATVGGLTVRVARLAERTEASAGTADPVWVEIVAERS